MSGNDCTGQAPGLATTVHSEPQAAFVTWINGELVTEEAPAYFARVEREAKQLAAHLDNLRPMSQRHMRTEYLAAVERKEGAPAMERLRAAFIREWATKEKTDAQ